MDEPAPVRRKMDTSTADVRRALAAILTRFDPWRADLIHFRAMLDRGTGASQRAEILARCDAIGGELMAARMDLLETLADAPPRVAGHSRVVDVERAIDGIEQELSVVRGLVG